MNSFDDILKKVTESLSKQNQANEQYLYEDLVRTVREFLDDEGYEVNEKELQDLIHSLSEDDLDYLESAASSGNEDLVMEILKDIPMRRKESSESKLKEEDKKPRFKKEKLDVKRIYITFTTDREKEVVNNHVDKYQDKVIGITKFADETIVDGDEKIIAELRSDLQHFIIQYPGISVSVEESRINEIAEFKVVAPVDSIHRRYKDKLGFFIKIEDDQVGLKFQDGKEFYFWPDEVEQVSGELIKLPESKVFESKTNEQNSGKPRVRKGDKINIFDYRGSKTLRATVINNPIYQDEEWEVAIQFDNGDKHYVVWDDKEQRWESGEGFYELKTNEQQEIKWRLGGKEKETLKKMEKGKWYTAEELEVTISVLDNLVDKGFLEKEADSRRGISYRAVSDKFRLREQERTEVPQTMKPQEKPEVEPPDDMEDYSEEDLEKVKIKDKDKSLHQVKDKELDQTIKYESKKGKLYLCNICCKTFRSKVDECIHCKGKDVEPIVKESKKPKTTNLYDVVWKGKDKKKHVEKDVYGDSPEEAMRRVQHMYRDIVVVKANLVEPDVIPEGKVFDVNKDSEEKKIKKLTETVLELVGELPELTAEDNQILRWAVKNNILFNEFPSNDILIAGLQAKLPEEEKEKLENKEDIDLHALYIQHVLLPRAKKAWNEQVEKDTGVSLESKVNEQEKDTIKVSDEENDELSQRAGDLLKNPEFRGTRDDRARLRYLRSLTFDRRVPKDDLIYYREMLLDLEKKVHKSTLKEQLKKSTYNVVAKGIVDKTEADRMAGDKKGMVVTDEEDPKKFMVIVKESMCEKLVFGKSDIEATDKEQLQHALDFVSSRIKEEGELEVWTKLRNLLQAALGIKSESKVLKEDEEEVPPSTIKEMETEVIGAFDKLGYHFSGRRDVEDTRTGLMDRVLGFHTPRGNDVEVKIKKHWYARMRKEQEKGVADYT